MRSQSRSNNISFFDWELPYIDELLRKNWSCYKGDWGSGLDKLLELIYASNYVTHIMSSKAVARSLRAHFLVESTLMGLLIEQAPKR